MLDKKNLLQILNTYNIKSNKYGPTIYEFNTNLGICLDIKESTFGFLTRIFIFNNEDEVKDFLNKYTWYKKNKNKYQITLNFDVFDIPNPNIKYIYNNEELTFNDMLNIKNIINEKLNKKEELQEKSIYLMNINSLTNYLITIKNNKIIAKQEKNRLKTTENDLKYELLKRLFIYYERPNPPEKKAISLDNIIQNNDISIYKNNELNIQNKSLDEIKNYLSSLINIIKQEELDEKYFIDVYSNDIYKYNIEVLTKQIEFVKHKIDAEKNFNLKGSKIHNIDEELKSFLKNYTPPVKLEDYITTNKNTILNKYNNIKDIKEAYHNISGNILNIPKFESKPKVISLDPIKDLISEYDNLDINTKNNLVLYNSFYKNICNYIIDNNPSIEDIKNNFDFDYYYNTLEEIIHNENNSHFLIRYFNNINFKTLDTYINSLINISKSLNTTIKLKQEIKLFTLNKKTTYQEYSLNPIYSSDTVYITIPENTSLIIIPEKIIIDEDTKELENEITNSIYIKGNIIELEDTITVNKYNKIQQKDKKSDIIITTELKLNNSYTFHLGKLEGKNE